MSDIETQRLIEYRLQVLEENQALLLQLANEVAGKVGVAQRSLKKRAR